MNLSYDIIPTPSYSRFTEGGSFKIKNLRLLGEPADVIDCAMQLLRTDVEGEQITLCHDLTLLADDLLDSEDLALFDREYAAEQGYVIKRDKHGELFAVAKHPVGCAYALLTLIQLDGKPVCDMVIRDAPDFEHRGVKWTAWAETGCMSYDFGDGVEALTKRLVRKLDMLFRYKINVIYADGFGFDANRYEGYAEVMRTLSDEARRRGILIGEGGYTMSYGMVGHLNSYQGKHFENRLSYPDGDIYECLGTYDRGKLTEDGKPLIRARTHGTCLSNSALFEQKMAEMTDFLQKTHVTMMFFHNMDADELHPALWEARCPECRKRWPNDALTAADGAAGAFADYIGRIHRRLSTVRDGDYDASKHLYIRMTSPGYCYAEKTSDSDFDLAVEFWRSVSELLPETDKLCIGFREQFFYHEKDIPRATAVKAITRVKKYVSQFCGCDGFYDDKVFGTAASLSYIMKGFDTNVIFNGNAYQEPLAVFNAEYLWNSERSGFYNVEPRPANQGEFVKLYHETVSGAVRPEAVYGKGGFIDVICRKLYGDSCGEKIAEIYKLRGKGGEPPIPLASSVDIYTNYTKVVYPMRWDNEMDGEEIAVKTQRFRECSVTSARARDILELVLADDKLCADDRADLTVLAECYRMGAELCRLLYEYMLCYRTADTAISQGDTNTEKLRERLAKLKLEIAEFTRFVNEHQRTPVDHFGGITIRRGEMAEFLDYNTDLIGMSLDQQKRIPDGRKPLRTRDWW